MNTKILLWLYGEVKSPPLSIDGRRELGYLLREIQEGVALSLPHSRPMPVIGSNVHELRVKDREGAWRLIYQIREKEILVLNIFKKKTQQTPQDMVEVCKKRIRHYEGTFYEKD